MLRFEKIEEMNGYYVKIFTSLSDGKRYMRGLWYWWIRRKMFKRWKKAYRVFHRLEKKCLKYELRKDKKSIKMIQKFDYKNFKLELKKKYNLLSFIERLKKIFGFKKIKEKIKVVHRKLKIFNKCKKQRKSKKKQPIKLLEWHGLNISKDADKKGESAKEK